MRILITGGSGFVASHLVDYCLEQGDEVIITCRWNEDLSRMQHFKDKVKIEYVELTDLSSVIRCINKHRPDVISHLAAQSWVPYSFDNPIYTLKTNIESTLNIIEAVRIIRDMQFYPTKDIQEPGYSEREITFIGPIFNPLIHICSSSEFYGKVERENLPITENHPANPGNPYGVSKVAVDFLAQLYKEYYDMRIVITRMFTHCGLRRTMMSAENFYAKSIAELEKYGGNEIQISNQTGMESIRTWADVRDAVKNYYTLFKSNKTGVFNIAGETTHSISEVLDYLLTISTLDKDKIRLVENPKFFRKVDVDKQVVDISKFKELGWTNEITFEQLMNDLLNYWRENV